LHFWKNSVLIDVCVNINLSNMLIGIDGNEANVEKRVGIGEYAYELLMQFYESQKSKVKSQNYNLKFKIYLKNRPIKDFPKEEGWWGYSVFGPRKLWTQIALPLNLYLTRPRPDVFFTPTHYAPRFSPVPTAVSIMDLSYIHFPEMFKRPDLYQLRNWTAYSVRNAKKVLTISQASKDDIIKEYGVPEDKVIVTYPGVKLKTQNSKFKDTMQNSKLTDKYGVKGGYILFVGTIQPRKNIARLIEAFSKIKNEIQLVIVGKKGWLYEEILETPKKLEIADRVKFLDFVTDEDLPIFYKNAMCFVLPSLYEGFGLPVLEAMQYGCPVITSNVSSLPEAGGDAALYVDPLNVDDIKKNLDLIINNSELRKKLIKKGYEQAARFSWEKTAKETLKVLTELK